MDDKQLNKLVTTSYYNKEYAQKYYQKRKAEIIKRSKERWANMSEDEKNNYYENRKKNRRDKK